MGPSGHLRETLSGWCARPECKATGAMGSLPRVPTSHSQTGRRRRRHASKVSLETLTYGTLTSAQSPYRLVWPFGRGRPSSANAHFPSEEGCRAEDDDHSSAPVPRPALSSLFRSVFVCGLIGICGLAIAVRMYRFWIQKGGADKAAAVRVVHHERRPIETLQQGVPELIPGLEDVGPGFSPCLTPDLRTIVFSNTGNPETAYDLYLAERKDASACFGQPRLIKSCASVDTDAYPTLTADGLELFFVRSDSRPEFYHARRASPSADFGDPVLWSVPAIPGADTAKLRIERPQFLDPLRLVFCAVDLEDNTRRCFMAKARIARVCLPRCRKSGFPTWEWVPLCRRMGSTPSPGTSEGYLYASGIARTSRLAWQFNSSTPP